MLEKMGWTKGRGLGANEDGAQEFVRLHFKKDSVGLGYAARDDQWTTHDESFNGLLKSLHGGGENGNASDSEEETRPLGFGFKAEVAAAEEPKPTKLKENLTGISLEEKSKHSKARVHYKKFTRGKDLAQYSEKDLANIFGKKATDEIEIPVQIKKLEEVKEEKPVNPNFAGVHTISTGLSVNDYFKQKMEAMKQKLAQNKNVENTSMNGAASEIASGDENVEEAPIKKKKKKKDKSREKEQEIMETEVPAEAVAEEPPKKKKKSKREAEENADAEEKKEQVTEGSNEPKRKKKKKDKEEIVAPCEVAPAEEEPKKKKKKKKSKRNEEINVEAEVDELTEESKLTEPIQEKIKGSKTEHKEENASELKEETPQEKPEKHAKKKSKKSKKEDNEEPHAHDETKSQTKSANGDDLTTTSIELPEPADEKQPETEVSAEESDNHGERYLSMEQLLKRQKSFNVFKISSFCAEKFHILDMGAFKNSSLGEIAGYSFDENIDLRIREIKSDAMRITSLWEGRLSKYSQRTDEERTRIMVRKLKYKRITGSHLKKLNNCNAFSGL